MTDARIPPLSDDDLSAIIDGEADDDDVARFTGDAVAKDRVRELQAASDLLRTTTVESLPAASVDDLVAAALGALDADPAPDEDSVTDHDAATPVEPVPLASRRRGRSTSSWLVAAAVVILAGIGLTLVWGGTRGTTHDDQAADTASATSSTAAAGRSNVDAAVGGAEPGASVEEKPKATVTATSLPDLGTYDSVADLRTGLKGGFPANAEAYPVATAPTATDIERCAGQTYEIFEPEGISDQPVREGAATVGGKPYLVFVFDLDKPVGTATQLYTAVEVVTCDPQANWVR
jgi:negative regulator of sigma E activity